MTDWAALREPFPEDEIKTRPGRGGLTFRYVDARVVAQRLDDVLTPEGWDFTWTSEGNDVVHGRLIIGGNIREDAGYPNTADDEEPIKSAVSDALKRCAVLFGVGRHLYEDNKGGRTAPPRSVVQPPPPTTNTGQQRTRPQLVDTDLNAPDDEDNPFDDPMNTAPVVRPDEDRCPWHPNREPKQGKYGLFCSGQGGNGPLNAKGYCEWKGAA